MGSALSWLKAPCCRSVDRSGTAGAIGLTFCCTCWTDIGSTSCSSGFIPGGAFFQQGTEKTWVFVWGLTRDCKDFLSPACLPSMPCRSGLRRCLCVGRWYELWECSGTGFFSGKYRIMHTPSKVTRVKNRSSVGTMITAWSWSLTTEAECHTVGAVSVQGKTLR